MPDSLVVVAFFWIGLSVFGFGFIAGQRHERLRWRAWLRKNVSL